MRSPAADRAAPAIAPEATRSVAVAAAGGDVDAAIPPTASAAPATAAAPAATTAPAAAATPAAASLRRRRGRANQNSRRADSIDEEQSNRRKAARQEIVACGHRDLPAFPTHQTA